MSYTHGWQAINLEMPERVPRTEYSAETHWDLVKAVTGLAVDSASSTEWKEKASSAFIKAWNYDLIWNILIHNQVFGEKRTKMGHAEYAAGGADYDAQISCLFDEPEEALLFDPFAEYESPPRAALIREFNADYERRRRENPDAVNMTGVYVTCMSGLIEIFGWEILLAAAGLDSDGLGRVADRYTAWMGQYFAALAESAAPVVMVHDDIVWTSGAFLHPDWYRKYIFPNYRRLFAPLHEAGKKIIYTSDGNYSQFIDDVAGCGIDGFVMEPATDMKYVAEKYGRTHVFIGNADTRVLLSGTREQIRTEVQRCMDIGKKCPGFFMAVGNHIPVNTPVENALYYNEIYDVLSRR